MNEYQRLRLRARIFRHSAARRLKERFKGSGWNFESEPHVESRVDRLTVLFNGMEAESFAGRSVLEVGCGHGHLGAALEDLGAKVTSIDGREDNIRQVRKKFPNRPAFTCDVGSADLEKYGPVDIVFAFGILYHLPRPAEFLARCSAMSDVLLMEGAVSDILEPEIVWVKERGFYDQAIDGMGCRPSPSWVEENLRLAGYNQVIDLSPAGAPQKETSRSGVFYWPSTGSGIGREYGDKGLRKMWLATKGNVSFSDGRLIS